MVGLYAILEPLLGIVNACLPLLRPVFQKTSFAFMEGWTGRTLGYRISGRRHVSRRRESLGKVKAGLSSSAEQSPWHDSEAYPLAKVQDHADKEEMQGLKGEHLGSNNDMRGITVERGWVVQVSGQEEV